MNAPSPEQIAWLRHSVAQTGSTEHQLILWLHDRLAALEAQQPAPQPTAVAQAVLDAFGNWTFGIDEITSTERCGLAAALRELASFSNGHWLTPARLYAMAAELEGDR